MSVGFLGIFAASDALSGIAGTIAADVTFDTDGANQHAARTFVDRAEVLVAGPDVEAGDDGATALVLAIIVGATVYQSHKNLVTVQTGKAQKQNLASVVSASGEIKPKTYVNIGANGYGKITKLFVHEGETVKKGQLLAKLDYVQSAADVAAMAPGTTSRPSHTATSGCSCPSTRRSTRSRARWASGGCWCWST